MNDEGLSRLLSYGLFAPIDGHFAKLMVRLNGEVRPELALAAAMVSRYTREGHICLDLREVAGKPLANHPEALICPELAHWVKQLSNSRVTGRPGEYRPLILDSGSRIYLYRYWQYQHRLAEAVKARLAGPPGSHLDGALKDRLERLFPASPTGEIDWQKVAAFAAACRNFSVISGGPGTGKTTTVAKILALLQEQAGSPYLRIALAAPTGKAAARLQEAIKAAKTQLPCPEPVRQAIPETASTIHRLLGAVQGSPYFRHHADNPLPVEVVVIDEASMVDLALMSKLFQALRPQARVILLGDKDQLASVEAGAVLGDICETGEKSFLSEEFRRAIEAVCGCRLDQSILADTPAKTPKDCVIQLQKSYRFADAGGIGVLSQKVRDRDPDGAMAVLGRDDYPAVTWNELASGTLLAEAARSRLVDGYRSYFEAVARMRSHPGGNPTARLQEVFDLFLQFRILCAVREGLCGVAALNDLVERLFEKERGFPQAGRWYAGRPVLIGRNDYNLHLFNGDVGIFLPSAAGGAAGRVFFPGVDGGFRSFHPLRLPEHETVFAMTVHKSQGSEFDHVMLVLPDRDSPVLTRELVYTGITRARESVSLWGPESLFRKAIGRSTQRMSGLADELWRIADRPQR